MSSELKDLRQLYGGDTSEQVLLEGVFDYAFRIGLKERPRSAREEYKDVLENASNIFDPNVIEVVQQLGQQAARAFLEAQLAHEWSLARSAEKRFPESLRERDPSKTPLVFLAVDEPLKDELDSYENPKVAALLGNVKSSGITVTLQTPQAAHLLEEENITFLSLSDSLYQRVASKRGASNRRVVHKFSEDMSIELFNLQQNQFGGAEYVLIYDKLSLHRENAFAEAVYRRTGKYPHFAILDRSEEKNDDVDFWRIYEFVPISPIPVKPTLRNYLGSAATKQQK